MTTTELEINETTLDYLEESLVKLRKHYENPLDNKEHGYLHYAERAAMMDTVLKCLPGLIKNSRRDKTLKVIQPPSVMDHERLFKQFGLMIKAIKDRHFIKEIDVKHAPSLSSLQLVKDWEPNFGRDNPTIRLTIEVSPKELYTAFQNGYIADDNIFKSLC